VCRLTCALLSVAVAFVLSPAGTAAAAPTSALDRRLVQTQQVDGLILDVSATKVLYLDTAVPSVLKLSDRTSHQVVAVPAVPGFPPGRGWLTPRGVVFIGIGASPRTRLYEWAGGAGVVYLGGVQVGSQPMVSGPYVLWNDSPGTLWRRNVVTGQSIHVASVPVYGADLDVSGDVIYMTGNPTQPNVVDMNRYHNGVTSQVPFPQGTDLPIVDGSSIAYNIRTGEKFYSLLAGWLYDGTRHIELSPTHDTPGGFIGPQVHRGLDIDAAGGWTAFRGPSGEVMVRNPTGRTYTLTTSGPVWGQSQIVAMNPRGETAFAVSADLYLGLPGRETIHVASGLGQWGSLRSDVPGPNYASFVDGRWVFGIGGRLYELTDRPPCHL
jgi:hypothetical protein